MFDRVRLLYGQQAHSHALASSNQYKSIINAELSFRDYALYRFEDEDI